MTGSVVNGLGSVGKGCGEVMLGLGDLERVVPHLNRHLILPHDNHGEKHREQGFEGRKHFSQ